MAANFCGLLRLSATIAARQLRHPASQLLLRTTSAPDATATRPFFAYFRVAFNSVDADRLREVGPDRLCAEWLLKNGGAVTFAGRRQVDDYNALGPTDATRRKLESVDATDASIMAIGFEHFRGCDQLRSVRLTRCKHLEDEALAGLEHVKDSLRELRVEDCFNVTESGLEAVGRLSQLERLEVSGVPYVKDVERIRGLLQAKLPACEISIRK